MIAFALQGGGSLSAAEVGALRALTEHGIVPDFVVGASAGALNAVAFAADPTAAGIDRLDGIWRSLRRRHVAPLSATALLAAAAGLQRRAGSRRPPAALHPDPAACRRADRDGDPRRMSWRPTCSPACL